MIILRRIRQSTIAFDWSHHGLRFRIPRKTVKLSKKYQKKDVHYLLACELRKSSIPFSGLGTFLREPAVKNQVIFRYGGRRISFKEADRLACQVIYKEILSKIVFLPFAMQGLDTHVKENNLYGFCYDCRPIVSCPLSWYVQHGLVAGFANSNCKQKCNAKFLGIGEEIFLVATKEIKEGEEVFVHYKVR